MCRLIICISRVFQDNTGSHNDTTAWWWSQGVIWHYVSLLAPVQQASYFFTSKELQWDYLKLKKGIEKLVHKPSTSRIKFSKLWSSEPYIKESYLHSWNAIIVFKISQQFNSSYGIIRMPGLYVGEKKLDLVALNPSWMVCSLETGSPYEIPKEQSGCINGPRQIGSAALSKSLQCTVLGEMKSMHMYIYILFCLIYMISGPFST